MENNNNYQNGKIYKIVCNVTNEIYIGSTIQTLNKRLKNHKYSKNCKSINIINRGDYEIILIKDYPCDSKWELEEEEGKYIRENDCINRKIPHRTNEEWKEHQKEYHKEYYENNKEKNKEKKKEYYENNKEKKKIKMKEYYENNKDKIKEYYKKYYQENKKSILEI